MGSKKKSVRQRLRVVMLARTSVGDANTGNRGLSGLEAVRLTRVRPRLTSVRLAHRAMPAEDAECRDDDDAAFDEELSAVEPVDRRILESGVGEEAVPEEGRGGDVDGEVERFPETAAEADAEIRRD